LVEGVTVLSEISAIPVARKYYSIRRGRSLDLDGLKVLFKAILGQLSEKGYFAESIGFECVDAGWIPGFVGHDANLYFVRHLRKQHLWPIAENLPAYSEDDLFDVIELLYDLVSKPVDGRMHSFGGCGMHWDKFDRSPGRADFRSEINDILADYGNGFELTMQGEITEKADTGLDSLISAELPSKTEDAIKEKVREAIQLFRRRHSTLTDRHNAVRLLADLLERLRPRIRAAITSKDEADLFNIANNFAIRHDNDKQKTNYDRALWLSWMFYFYLATLHYAARKLVQADGQSTGA